MFRGVAGHAAAMDAMAVYRPNMSIRATIVVLAFGSVLLLADTSVSRVAPAAQAARPAGPAEEREGLVARFVHTEIFSPTLYSVGGMLLFPVSNDLLTMFVAPEVVPLAVVSAVRAGSAPSTALAQGGGENFLLGAFSAAFFLSGIAMLYGYAGSVRLSAIASAASTNTTDTTLLFAGIALAGLGLLFQMGEVPFHGGSRTCTRGLGLRSP